MKNQIRRRKFEHRPFWAVYMAAIQLWPIDKFRPGHRIRSKSTGRVRKASIWTNSATTSPDTTSATTDSRNTREQNYSTKTQTTRITRPTLQQHCKYCYIYVSLYFAIFFVFCN